MSSRIRKVVHIDQERCDGCGLCVPACHEGAIEIVNGKAQLVAERLCDGLGDCLGHCPQDAIRIEERAAEAYDEQAVYRRLAALEGSSTTPCDAGSFSAPAPPGHRQWPVQLSLIPASAPYLSGAEILLVADCVPVACRDFHDQLRGGRVVALACPKLDGGELQVARLAAILKDNPVCGLAVAYMEVPCCSGLLTIAREAIRLADKALPLETIKVGIAGELKGE